MNSIAVYEWSALVFGKDGTLWVAASQPRVIDQMRTDGTVRRFPMPGHAGEPIAIVASGPNLWIVQPG